MNHTKNFGGKHRFLRQTNPSLFERHDHNNMRNFTTVRETPGSIITERKKIICGSGVVLTKQYTKWPDSRRERVEIKLGSEVSNDREEDRSMFEWKPSTETSTTFDTVQTPPFPQWGEHKRHTTEGRIPHRIDESILRETAPALGPGSSRKNFQADSKKLIQEAYLLESNISYQSSNNSQILKNPFDETNLVTRLKHIKRPILFHLLFPDDNIFCKVSQDNVEKSYKVKVQLFVTLEDLENEENEVKLMLTETSLIVLHKKSSV